MIIIIFLFKISLFYYFFIFINTKLLFINFSGIEECCPMVMAFVQVRRRACLTPWLPARQGVGHGCMKGWPPYLMAMTLFLNGGESYASDGQMRE